ncbi:uncharacterized protein EI97DRAFT_57117 [Westerdykella ornata]|uniref:Uncharacterized protein n=1 Tax=Westerdykella ornata TaxID=318751 RepID=A0A6A6JHF1_WESOR|nr:uncharacterized protein EI97DRAFT_57117 [Westerdykella ornata]KAF2275832.1 hypothetical protein EI97DRAFT_57117 [Westerdykella ornata]
MDFSKQRFPSFEMMNRPVGATVKEASDITVQLIATASTCILGPPTGSAWRSFWSCSEDSGSPLWTEICDGKANDEHRLDNTRGTGGLLHWTLMKTMFRVRQSPVPQSQNHSSRLSPSDFRQSRRDHHRHQVGAQPHGMAKNRSGSRLLRQRGLHLEAFQAEEGELSR